MSQKNKHDECCRLIAIKPQLIDLEDITISTNEAHLFHSKKGIILQEPDSLMFDFKTNTLYSIEYKCSDQKIHAIDQLMRRYDLLKSQFTEWNIVNLYIHDNYKVERIMRY